MSSTQMRAISPEDLLNRAFSQFEFKRKAFFLFQEIGRRIRERRDAIMAQKIVEKLKALTAEVKRTDSDLIEESQAFKTAAQKYQAAKRRILKILAVN